MKIFTGLLAALLGFGWFSLPSESPESLETQQKADPMVFDCNAEQMDERWKIEVDGVGAFPFDSIISITFNIVGLDSAPATSIELLLGNQGLSLLSGYLLTTYSFYGNDSFAMLNSIDLPDTGRYIIRLRVHSDSFWSDTSNTMFEYVYVLADSDSVHIDTISPAYFYPPLDPHPDSAQQMGSGGSVTVKGTVVYEDLSTNGADAVAFPKVKVCLVEPGLGTSYSTHADENGEFEISGVYTYTWYVLHICPEVPGAWLSEKDDEESVFTYDAKDYYTEPKFIWTESGTHDLDSLFVSPEEWAHLLTLAYWSRRFCQVKFSYTPSAIVKISYPKTKNRYLAGFNTIQIGSSSVWQSWGRYILSHEFGHHVDQHAIGIPQGANPPDQHSRPKKTNPKFALKEGWAEFFGSAVVDWHFTYDDDDGDESQESYWEITEYFNDNSGPYWENQGSCTHGDSVEGAVAQFLYDLYDDDPAPGFPYAEYDDDGITEVGKMWEVFTEEKPNTITEFKTAWDNCYPNDDIDELYNVVIHPFEYSTNYELDKPTNFKPSYDFENDELDLSWTNNTENQGRFGIVYSEPTKDALTEPDREAAGDETSLSINDPPYESGYKQWRIHAVVADTSPRDTFLYAPKSYDIGFENSETTSPYENSPWENNPVNVTNVVAQRTSSDKYSGDKSYKFSGTDNSPEGSYAYYNLFNIWSPIFEPTLAEELSDNAHHNYLSAYFKVVSSPDNKGHISFDGILDPWARLESIWDDDYGWVVDQYGQRIKADIHNTLPQGEWKQFVFNLAPAHENMLKNISLAYNDSLGSETGDFEVYIDQLKFRPLYPNDNEWFVEVFGGDKNADVTWQEGDNQIDLIVDGNGAGDQSEGWVGSTDYHIPCIREDLSGSLMIDDDDVLSWEQYDKAHALIFSLLLSPSSEGGGKWLSYTANASYHWGQQGFVNMGETETCYNEWEPFARNVVDDYNAEFDPDVSTLYLHALRLGHFARREWDGDHGGSVRWISLIDGGPGGGGGDDEIPPLDWLKIMSPNGGERWEIGSERWVDWNWYENYYPEVAGYMVEYCTDYGNPNVTWKPIDYCSNYNCTAQEHCGIARDWQISADETPSKTCRARVLAMKSENGVLKPVGYDISDANFELYKLFIGPSPEPFAPFVWPPEEQEGIICSNPMIAGGQFEIGWIADGIHPVDSVSLHYSTDGGKTFQVIATGLDPGEEVVFDSCEVDTGMIYYTARHGFYSWTVPATPTCGGKFRYVAYDSTGDSAEYVFTETFSIPFALGSIYSTAYTGSKLGDGSSKTCMVYTDASNNVVYCESDDGFEWDTSITVVQAGATPTVTVVNDTPVVVWKDNNLTDQTLYRSAFPFAAVTPLVPAFGGDRIQILSEANVFPVEDSFYVGVFRAYGYTQLSHLALVGKRLDLAGCASSDTLFEASGSIFGVPEAPALVVDNEHNAYYAFVYNDKTIFIYDDGSSLDTDTIATTSVAWPSLDVTTGNVYLTYGTVISGDTVILRKWRYTNDTIWRGTDTLYKGPVSHLSTAGGVFTSFTEANGDMRLLTFDPLEGSAETEYLADSVFNPHVALSRLSDPELAFEWTEKVGANYYIMSDRKPADAILPFLYLEGGTTITPFTTHRDRTHDYGEIEVDIGSDSLVYTINGLDTTLDYNLALEFYFEDDSVETREFVVTAAGETDTVTVSDSTLIRYTLVIDSPDSDLAVKITGEDIGLARIVLYEADGTQGYLSQGREKEAEEPKRLPLEFALENVIPTPFIKTAQIRFAMPVAQRVTLKVYDVAGREVRTLVNGPVDAGVHTLDWDGKDNLSRSVSSGVYFVRMATEGYQATRKTVLLK